MEYIQTLFSNTTVVLVFGLITLSMLDYASGAYKAKVKGNLSSSQMRTGATIKIVQISILFILFTASWATKHSTDLRMIHALLAPIPFAYGVQLVASEYLSIRENLIDSGLMKRTKHTEKIDELAEKIVRE